jgi:glycolate oxidase FAD binding subunit
MSVMERILPKSPDELSALVARCDRDGRNLDIVGGDTLRGMGLPAQRPDLTVVTTALSGVVAYEASDLTIGALSGTPLQAIATLLATHRQFIPFDAPLPVRATLGGTLAAGWLGPRRHAYGRPRDYVLGSTIVLADGTIARAGGMVVKNVAGYDLSRLYVGSFGTLGILVRANLKTLAIPGRARVFLARLPERTRARAFNQLWSLAIRPSAAFWIDGFNRVVDGDDGDDGRLLVMLEGSDAVLERGTRDLRSALGRAGIPETTIVDAGARESFERTIDAYVAPLGERSVTYRLHPFPEDSEKTALALGELARRSDLRNECIVDVMNGDVILRVSALDMRALGAKIEPFDDELHEVYPDARVIASDHPHRAHLRVWGRAPDAIERMRALKMRFDPNRTLNAGRFVGGI